MSVLKECFTLRNGVTIPKIGFGTAPLKGQEAYDAIKNAIDIGYRHIDTAQNYGNEEEVGKAIKDSHLPREAFFITTKLDSKIKTYKGTIEALETSLNRLDTDYVDLYLIHAPWPWDQKFSNHDAGNVEAFKAMEHLLEVGKVRAIGVSNFEPKHLENIKKHCKTTPMVNQIKYHIGHTQQATIDYCNKEDILVEAYSPLGRGKVFEDETLKTMAQKYNVSVSRLCVRYILEKGILPLPRSAKREHIKSNKDVDFIIETEDMESLDKLTIESIEFGTPVKNP